MSYSNSSDIYESISVLTILLGPPPVEGAIPDCLQQSGRPLPISDTLQAKTLVAFVCAVSSYQRPAINRA